MGSGTDPCAHKVNFRPNRDVHIYTLVEMAFFLGILGSWLIGVGSLTGASSDGGGLSLRAISKGVPDACRFGPGFGIKRLGSLADFLKGGDFGLGGAALEADASGGL